MERTWMPKTAGVLNIISGAFLCTAGIAIISLPGKPMATSIARYVTDSMELSVTLNTSIVNIIIYILALVLIIPGIVALLGGFYALRRSTWGLALSGTIFTLFYLPPLGIFALLLIALSKKEFHRPYGHVSPYTCEIQ